jgi:hypothetical protein
MRERKWSGIAEESANGSSKMPTMSCSSAATCLGAISSSSWVEPRRFATRRAHGVSSYVASEKPTEKVRTEAREVSVIRQTTALESIPPDRKAPIGTSLTI